MTDPFSMFLDRDGWSLRFSLYKRKPAACFVNMTTNETLVAPADIRRMLQIFPADEWPRFALSLIPVSKVHKNQGRLF